MTLKPSMTAAVVRGATTNHVRVYRRARGKIRVQDPRPPLRAVAVKLSMSPGDLAAIDRAAAAAQMSRSQWMRQAARYFAEWLRQRGVASSTRRS